VASELSTSLVVARHRSFCMAGVSAVCAMNPARFVTTQSNIRRPASKKLHQAGSLTSDSQALGFHKPIVLPSGSCIHAKVPVGISTGGTSVLPPSALAFSR